MLEHWIGTNLHLREGHAVTNFDMLAEINSESDLANELLKDPYDFSFLSLTEKYREQELKDALVGNIEKCFWGRTESWRPRAQKGEGMIPIIPHNKSRP